MSSTCSTDGIASGWHCCSEYLCEEQDHTENVTRKGPSFHTAGIWKHKLPPRKFRCFCRIETGNCYKQYLGWGNRIGIFRRVNSSCKNTTTRKFIRIILPLRPWHRHQLSRGHDLRQTASSDRRTGKIRDQRSSK